MNSRVIAVILTVLLVVSSVSAQKAEVSIALNEAFFDALLESVFQNFDPPEFSIASTGVSEPTYNTKVGSRFTLRTSLASYRSSFAPTHAEAPNSTCNESIKILRDMNGVRTAAKFRDGKIVVPLAFSGNYAAPLIGCIEFAGWAESNVDLEFDQNAQKLFGKVRVLRVNLSGTAGIGGTVIAKLIQSSIDKKLNPIEILSLDKVSLGFPIQKSGVLQMKAFRIRPEVGNGVLNIRVDYEFVKG